MKLSALLVILLWTGSAVAVPVDFHVEASANSSSGGTGLDTGIFFNAGDPILVSTDPTDIWSAGALPRWSNADGLVADLFATGSDESGQSAGTLIGQLFVNHSQAGLIAPFGSLVGSLGGNFFLLGSSFNGPAPGSGNLLLHYWDSNFGDNSDSIRVTVDDGSNGGGGNRVPAPGVVLLIGLGLLGMAGARLTHR